MSDVVEVSAHNTPLGRQSFRPLFPKWQPSLARVLYARTRCGSTNIIHSRHSNLYTIS